eukprot:6214681-Pleurochrysis_carterae.AAC.8
MAKLPPPPPRSRFGRNLLLRDNVQICRLYGIPCGDDATFADELRRTRGPRVRLNPCCYRRVSSQSVYDKCRSGKSDRLREIPLSPPPLLNVTKHNKSRTLYKI